MKTKRVYISTPLKPEKFRLDQIQKAIIRERVFAFIPTTEVSSTDPKLAAILNLTQLELCDEVWVFGPIGRDCAWEMGFASGRGIPVRFFCTEENEGLVETDWMLFLPGTEVVK